MPDRDRSSTIPRRKATGGDSRYLVAGAFLVAVLVGAYVLMGTPGLHTQVANAPAHLDSAMQQPPVPPAPATPAR